MNVRTIAALGLIVAVAFAHPLAGAAQDAGKALSILADARKAIGDGTLSSLHTFSLESANQRNVGQMQLSSTVQLLMALPDKYLRTETMISPGTGTSSVGFNGSASLSSSAGAPGGGLVIRIGPGGGSFGPGGDKPSPEQQAENDRLAIRSAQTDLSRMMLGWFAMALPAVNAQYAYAGEAESPDGKAFMVDVTNAEGFKARLFVDEQTHLPLMVTYQAPQPRVVTVQRGQADHGSTPPLNDFKNEPPVMAEYSLYFDDWRDESGFKFPFKLRRAMGGATTEEWTVAKIRMNPKIDDKKFEPSK